MVIIFCGRLFETEVTSIDVSVVLCSNPCWNAVTQKQDKLFKLFNSYAAHL